MKQPTAIVAITLLWATTAGCNLLLSPTGSGPAGSTGMVPSTGTSGGATASPAGGTGRTGAFYDLAPLATLTATFTESRVLGGRSSTDPTDGHADPGGAIAAADTLGDLALASLWYQNGYYTDGTYNDADWNVERGTVGGLPAYRIHPAATRASDFLGSRHGIFYRFPEQADWNVSRLDGASLRLVATLDAAAVNPGQFTRVPNLEANDIGVPTTLVFSKPDQTPSALHDLGNGVRGARLADLPQVRVVQVRYPVEGALFDTIADYTKGPADWENIYGQHRRYFPVRGAGRTGVVWQDRASKTLRATWLGENDPAEHETVTLPGDAGHVLAAAEADGQGNLFLLTIEEGDGRPLTARQVRLRKCDERGADLASVALDAGDGGLDMVEFGRVASTDNHATMRLSGDRLGLMLARTMLQSNDGLNHQGGIAVVFDARTLALQKNLGQTSGHSFENVLSSLGGGRFLGLDLGDNYPRGVHLHRFDERELTSRVVYSFKTEHGTEATNPAGRAFESYPEISGGGRTFYKWSNDNRTYTELGGAHELSNGIAVVFATERSQLDNSRAAGELNDARDLAAVVVRRDFEQASRGAGDAVVTDDLVLSQGDTPVTGGFYTFGGTFEPQRNAGVVWLTDHGSSGRHASRIKTHALDGDRILVLWEEWTGTAYQDTRALVVGSDGKARGEAFSLGTAVRLGRRDDAFGMAGGVAVVAGERAEGSLVVTLLFP